MVLIERYAENFCARLDKVIPGYNGPRKASVEKLPESIRYLLLSKLTHRSATFQPLACTFPTIPPLLTSSFVHDLVHMLTPDEKNTDGALAWKAAWTTVSSIRPVVVMKAKLTVGHAQLTCSGEWSTLVEVDDPILGHGAVNMSNRYLRLALNNPDDSAILPFLRANVFLKHRLGGFLRLECFMYENLDKYSLRKMATKLEDYAPALEPGISIDRIAICVETLLKQWMKLPVSGTMQKQEITLGKAREMMKTNVAWAEVTQDESWYLTVIFAMLSNSEAMLHKYSSSRRASLYRSSLTKKLIYALVRYTCNRYAFQYPAAYHLRHDWNNIATRTTVPVLSSWDGIVVGPKNWEILMTEAEEELLAREYNDLHEVVALQREQKTLEKFLFNSRLAKYTFVRTGADGAEELVEELDELFVQGINMMRAVRRLCATHRIGLSFDTLLTRRSTR